MKTKQKAKEFSFGFLCLNAFWFGVLKRANKLQKQIDFSLIIFYQISFAF